MRYALLATALFLGATSIANAVQLKDCSKGTTNQRLACLQGNIGTLNTAYEATTGQLADLKKQVDAIKPPDLSNVVRRTDSFKLGFDSARCLSFASGEGGELAGSNPPIKAQLLMLLQDCGGSPSLSFK